MSQWVRHISGQGEKWRVTIENELQWGSTPPHESPVSTYWLPKSEYVICDPPEQWRDVTATCEFNDYHNHLNLCAGSVMAGQYIPLLAGYRLRKVQLFDIANMPEGFLTSVEYPPRVVAETTTTRKQWAFLVERKQP